MMPIDTPQDTATHALDTEFGASGLSRRDFIRLNSALLVAAATVSCSAPEDFSDLRRSFNLFRAEDLLSLRFRLHNLQIVHRAGSVSRLVRIDEGLDAFLVVVFPGQHISEQTYGAETSSLALTDDMTAHAVIARPTRLVFRIPRGSPDIELRSSTLLDWQQWEALTQVSAEAVKSGLAGTRIEAPLGLTLAPSPASRWMHALNPVTHAGRTELWHTRLGSETAKAGAQILVQPAGYSVEEAFDGALTPTNRRDLVGKSLSARTLILSPMGGWLDLRGAWNKGPIGRWEHQATAGQDQRVLIQREPGFLYPFGHRATLTVVTEREIDRSGGPPVALLRKRRFIVVKEPEKIYDHDTMALQAMTVRDLVTPSLAVKDDEADALWIEIAEGLPFRFRFVARDWDKGVLEFDAPAVFVSANGTAAQATALYEDDGYAEERVSALGGQTGTIARFLDPKRPDRDRWDVPLPKPRSAGDTSLRLLSLRFSAIPVAATELQPSGGSAPFSCQTQAMQASVPALEQFLDSEQNQGWFERVNPEQENNNPGELFAKHLDGETRIPLFFDQQADRCGGLAMPSLHVDGLSRVLGPVGDSASLNGDAPIDWTQYLAPERAHLLGRFPLTDMLLNSKGTKSLLVPRVDFTVVEKDAEPETKTKTKTENETEDEPEQKPTTQTYKEVGVALTWMVPLERGASLPFIALEPKYGKQKKSLMQLEIAAAVSKALAKPAAKENGADIPEDEQAAGASTLSWSAKARLKNFELHLGKKEEPIIVVGFEYLGIALGPPKPESKTEQKKDPDQDPQTDEPVNDADANTAATKRPARFSAKIEHKISGIDAKGLLSYVQRLLDSASHLPQKPTLPQSASAAVPSSSSDRSYPAKLPALGKADVNLKLGPFKAADFQWLKFTVSNVAVGFGMGFYFFPREKKGSEQPQIPDHEFWLRLADPDKPLTLLAEPWGGIAHLGMNFTTAGLTGFQMGLGVLYRVTLDLKVTEAKCEGSLAGIFTYVANERGGKVDVDIVLRLSGRATLHIVDVHLLIVAVGKWAERHFSFRADVYLRIKIAFFTVPLHFAFEARSGEEEADRGSNGQGRAALQDSGLPDADRLMEEDWLSYRSAFAGTA